MLRAMADPLTEEMVGEANRMVHIASEIDAGLEGIRIGVPSNYFFDALEPEISSIVQNAIDALVMLGAEQVQVELESVDRLAAAQLGILTLEAYQNVMAATDGDITRVNSTLRARLKDGMDASMRSGEDLLVALGRLRAERDDALAGYRRATGNVDVLVAPVLQRSPPTVEAARTDYQWMPNLTRPFNASHQPVISVPCGWTKVGLPVGLQIVAPKYRERTAIRVAYTYEQSQHAPERRWPSVPVEV